MIVYVAEFHLSLTLHKGDITSSVKYTVPQVRASITEFPDEATQN